MIKLSLRSLLLISFLFAASSLFGAFSGSNIQDTIRYASPFAEANEACFKCHSLRRFEYTDEVSGKQKRGLMLPLMILGKQQFYESNHKNFSCTDCHSHDFAIYPHPEELKTELHFHCLDCHGGDPSYAVFKFEEIDAEYRKSVHFSLEEKGFTCWNCHDPHSYRLMARNSKNIQETVLYDNTICLDCHSDNFRFRSFSDRPKINFKKSHKWLPNRVTHLKSLRCIDCHTRINENILVSHLIVPGDEAVRDCNKCHSDKPVAMNTLLMIRSKDDDFKEFNNASVLAALKIIGSGRNRFLNNLSLIILASVAGIIAIHILFRIIRK